MLQRGRGRARLTVERAEAREAGDSPAAAQLSRLRQAAARTGLRTTRPPVCVRACVCLHVPARVRTCTCVHMSVLCLHVNVCMHTCLCMMGVHMCALRVHMCTLCLHVSARARTLAAAWPYPHGLRAPAPGAHLSRATTGRRRSTSPPRAPCPTPCRTSGRWCGRRKRHSSSCSLSCRRARR